MLDWPAMLAEVAPRAVFLSTAAGLLVAACGGQLEPPDTLDSGLPDAAPAVDAAGAVDAGDDSAEGPFFRRPGRRDCNPATAPAPAVLRLVSWNIARGRETSIAQVAEELVKMAPDVVLAQEVDVGTNRSGKMDQPQVLAQALGMEHTFAAAIPYDGGVFGMAIFARFPFSDVQVRRLDPTGAIEQRIGLSAWLCVGAARLRVVSFHGDHYYPDSAARNAAELAQWVAADIGDGAILAGDFNAEFADRGPQAVLAAGLVDLMGKFDPSPTLGSRRIDFVFGDPEVAKGLVSAKVGPSRASDHLPLVVELQPPAPRSR